MNVFQINSHDNVAVAVDAVAKGSVVTAGGKTFTVCQDIPAGHKVALADCQRRRRHQIRLSHRDG